MKLLNFLLASAFSAASAFAAAPVIQHYDTVADMVAGAAPTAGDIAIVAGRNAIGDGVGGTFYGEAITTSTNMGTIFAQANADAVKWVRSTPVDSVKDTTVLAAFHSDNFPASVWVEGAHQRYRHYYGESLTVDMWDNYAGDTSTIVRDTVNDSLVVTATATSVVLRVPNGWTAPGGTYKLIFEAKASGRAGFAPATGWQGTTITGGAGNLGTVVSGNIIPRGRWSPMTIQWTVDPARPPVSTLIWFRVIGMTVGDTVEFRNIKLFDAANMVPSNSVRSTNGGVWVPENPTLVTDLAKTVAFSGYEAFPIGRSALNDKAGGFFVAAPNSASVLTNRGTVFAVNKMSPVKWTRQYNGTANALWWGVDPAVGNDDTVATRDAIAAAKDIYFPEGEYIVNQQLDLPDGVRLKGAGSAKTMFDFSAVAGGTTVGFYGMKADRPMQELADVAATVGKGQTNIALATPITIGMNDNVWIGDPTPNGGGYTMPASNIGEYLRPATNIVNSATLEILDGIKWHRGYGTAAKIYKSTSKGVGLSGFTLKKDSYSYAALAVSRHRNVKIEDVIVDAAASMVINIEGCKDIVVYRSKALNQYYARAARQEGYGMVISRSQNALVDQCEGRGWIGHAFATGAGVNNSHMWGRNLVVRNSSWYQYSGFIGLDAHEGQEDVVFENNQVVGGIYMRGGSVRATGNTIHPVENESRGISFTKTQEGYQIANNNIIHLPPNEWGGWGTWIHPGGESLDGDSVLTFRDNIVILSGTYQDVSKLAALFRFEFAPRSAAGSSVTVNIENNSFLYEGSLPAGKSVPNLLYGNLNNTGLEDGTTINFKGNRFLFPGNFKFGQLMDIAGASKPILKMTFEDNEFNSFVFGQMAFPFIDLAFNGNKVGSGAGLYFARFVLVKDYGSPRSFTMEDNHIENVVGLVLRDNWDSADSLDITVSGNEFVDCQDTSSGTTVGHFDFHDGIGRLEFMDNRFSRNATKTALAKPLVHLKGTSFARIEDNEQHGFTQPLVDYGATTVGVFSEIDRGNPTHAAPDGTAYLDTASGQEWKRVLGKWQRWPLKKETVATRAELLALNPASINSTNVWVADENKTFHWSRNTNVVRFDAAARTDDLRVTPTPVTGGTQYTLNDPGNASGYSRGPDGATTAGTKYQIEWEGSVSRDGTLWYAPSTWTNTKWITRRAGSTNRTKVIAEFVAGGGSPGRGVLAGLGVAQDPAVQTGDSFTVYGDIILRSFSQPKTPNGTTIFAAADGGVWEAEAPTATWTVVGNAPVTIPAFDSPSISSLNVTTVGVVTNRQVSVTFAPPLPPGVLFEAQPIAPTSVRVDLLNMSGDRVSLTTTATVQQ